VPARPPKFEALRFQPAVLVVRSINMVTYQATPRSNLFKRKTTGEALNSAMPIRMRSLSSSIDLTRMCRKNVRTIQERAHSIGLSQEPRLGVGTYSNRPRREAR